MNSLNASAVDVIDLTRPVREMYTAVALRPEGDHRLPVADR